MRRRKSFRKIATADNQRKMIKDCRQHWLSSIILARTYKSFGKHKHKHQVYEHFHETLLNRKQIISSHIQLERKRKVFCGRLRRSNNIKFNALPRWLSAASRNTKVGRKRSKFKSRKSFGKSGIFIQHQLSDIIFFLFLLRAVYSNTTAQQC